MKSNVSLTGVPCVGLRCRANDVVNSGRAGQPVAKSGPNRADLSFGPDPVFDFYPVRRLYFAPGWNDLDEQPVVSPGTARCQRASRPLDPVAHDS